MTGSGEAERRQLTVLFCDMVGSTQIAAELGAEQWRELLHAYQQSVADVVERFDGSVAQYLGDGVVAYFGHPRAHEDDAERAARAGLAIVETLSARGPELEERHGRALAVRCGIHTGPVVIGGVGRDSRHETLAVGAATNVAARVQAEAGPGEALISAATLRLVRGIFVTEDLGPRELKGIATPVQLYRVIEPSGASSRLDIEPAAALTPFVARTQQLDLLQDSWSQARAGRGQLVLLGGDAGMGKSRLVRVFRTRLADESHRWVECRASKFHEHTAFHPLSEPIEQTLNLDRDQPVEQQRLRLKEGLEAMGLDPEEVAPLFASLLGVSFEEHESPFAAAAEARRKQTLEALTKWLLALAKSQPTVLVIEDLHWIDSSTLDLLSLLIDRVSDAPMMLLPTHRLNFHPPWTLGSNAKRVTLNPLTRSQTKAMILGITGGTRLPDAVRNQVLMKTDGVPLYVEEFTQTVLESGVLDRRGDQYEETGPIPNFSVPATLQDSLMARLDRLGSAKTVAQMAAVLGREFSQEVLAAVVTDAQSLEGDLSSLLGAGILRRTDIAGRASFKFKHALIEETAYHSLLNSTRRAWHAQVANEIEQHFPAYAIAEPERLARHCEEGELIERAVGYYQSAAEQARQRSASSESIRYLSRGIELLRTLPDGVERSERELMLQLDLGMTLVATEGWGSNGARAAYQQARELCEHIGEVPETFRIMRGLITFYTARAELGPAHDLTDRLMELAEQAGESHLLLLAHQQTGILHYLEGNATAALEQFERATALYEPSEHRHLAQLHGEDLGVFARIWMAWAQWILGYSDQAVETIHEALALAEEVVHRFSLAYAFVWTAILYLMRREHEPAREMAEQAIAISEQQGFGFLLAEGRALVAWSRLHEPLDESAMKAAADEFQECVTRVAGQGVMANGPVMIGYLAEGHHRAGNIAQAMESLGAALTLSQVTGQFLWEAELHRMKGEFLWQDQGEEEEAEHLFLRGIEMARTQKALSLELRVAVSLGRLWVEQGKPQRAREFIEPIYARFTEGFDSPDLVEAREVLGRSNTGAVEHG